MRDARTEENKRLFSIDKWLSRNQIQSYFSRLSVLKKKNTTALPGQAIEVVDAVGTEGVVQEEEWLQQVDEVYQNLSVQHPIYYDGYNLCDLYRKEKLSSFNVEMLKSVCKHFEISFKSKDRKHLLVEQLASMIAECSCGRR